MDGSDEAVADAEAALDLIRMLGQPRRFTEALQALLDARWSSAWFSAPS